MPPLPPAGNVIRVQLQHKKDADLNILDRLYFAYTGSPPAASDLNTYCTSVAAAWNTSLKPEASPDITLTEVIAEDLSSSSGAVGADTVAIVGTRSGGIMAAQTAVLVNFQLSRRYRGGKPRVYLPYGSQTDLSNGQQWGNTFTSAFHTAFTTFLAAISTATVGPATLTGQVSVSYYKDFTSVQDPITMRWRNIPTPRATPVVDGVSSFTVNPSLGSQRRRTRA